MFCTDALYSSFSTEAMYIHISVQDIFTPVQKHCTERLYSAFVQNDISVQDIYTPVQKRCTERLYSVLHRSGFPPVQERVFTDIK